MVAAVMPAIHVARRGRAMCRINDNRRRRAMARVSDYGWRNDNGRWSDDHGRAVMMMPQRNAEADPRARLRRSRKHRDCNCTKEE